MLKKTDHAEKRQFGRRETHLRGWVRVAGRPPISCIVRDLSQGGALLEFMDDTWLPFGFRLTTECKQVDRYCEPRHKQGTRIGVQFVAAPDHAVVSGSTSASAEISGWMGKEQRVPRR